MHRKPETTIQLIMSRPRLLCRNQMSRYIISTIIASGYNGTKFVHTNFAVVIAVDNPVCNVNCPVFASNTRLICLYSQFRQVARRNALTAPDFFSVCFVQQIGVGIAKRCVVQTNDINGIAQRIVFHHLCSNIPCADFVRSNQFDFPIIIRCIPLMVKPIPQKENPRLIRCICFVLICTDKIKLQAVKLIRCFQCLLIPSITGIQTVLLTDCERSCDPCRIAPANEIQCDIWIDRLCIRSKLESSPSCDICPFFC